MALPGLLALTPASALSLQLELRARRANYNRAFSACMTARGYAAQ